MSIAIAVDSYNQTDYNIWMSINKHKTITFKCLYCGKENTKFVRHDLKYKFCNQSCNGKYRVSGIKFRDKAGDKNPSWKGGRNISQGGYVLIYKPDYPYHNGGSRNKYVFEHRFVMEKKLGRLLREGEVIHHINGDKTDNRVENLMLFESHAKHMVLESRLRDSNPIRVYKQGKIKGECLRCSGEYTKNSPVQKYCEDCKKKYGRSIFYE